HRHARHVQCLLAGDLAHVGDGLFVGRDPALGNARALQDPLVRRLYHFFEIGVGEDLGRRIASRARDLCYGAFHTGASRRAKSAPMCSLTLPSTLEMATLMAFLMARSDELPWQMIDTPFTPRSGAPPYSE